jgi:hypothetical protein
MFVEPMHPNLREKAEALSAQPGVYVFKDETGQPIYAGKGSPDIPAFNPYWGKPAVRN